MNLNELNIPDDADTALDWAVRREFGLRWDAYHGGLVRRSGWQRRGPRTSTSPAPTPRQRGLQT